MMNGVNINPESLTKILLIHDLYWSYSKYTTIEASCALGYLLCNLHLAPILATPLAYI